MERLEGRRAAQNGNYRDAERFSSGDASLGIYKKFVMAPDFGLSGAWKKEL